MADPSLIAAGDRPQVPGKTVTLWLLAVAILLTLSSYAVLLPDWLHRLPEAAIAPFAAWFDVGFVFVRDDLGLLDRTRIQTTGLEWVMDASGNLCYAKNRGPNLGPIHCTALAALVRVIGFNLGCWKPALPTMAVRFNQVIIAATRRPAKPTK